MSKELYEKLLKHAKNQLSFWESEVFRLERSIEFGRCKRCKEPLMGNEIKDVCDGCIDEPYAERICEHNTVLFSNPARCKDCGKIMNKYKPK